MTRNQKRIVGLVAFSVAAFMAYRAFRQKYPAAHAAATRAMSQFMPGAPQNFNVSQPSTVPTYADEMSKVVSTQ